MDSVAFVRSRRGTILLAAALVVGAIVAWYLLGPLKAHRNGRDYAGQLQEAIAQRQTHDVEKLLEQIRTEKHLLNSGNVNEAVAAAAAFLIKEQALLKNYEAAYARILKNFTGDPDAAQLADIADQLATVRNALNALAPDLKRENEPSFLAFESQWQKFLSQSSAAVNNLLGQWIAAAEQQCNVLDYQSSLEKSETQLAAVAALIQKINNCESEYANQLSLSGDLLKRSNTVRAKLAAFDGEITYLDDNLAALAKAGTLKEFNQTVNLIAASDFSRSPAVMAASAVAALNLNDETTLRILLGLTNADTWACVKTGTRRFIPETALPAERSILQQFNNDPAVSSNLHRYRFWLDPDGSQTLEWITVGTLDNTLGWKRIMSWPSSQYAAIVQFEEQDYGFFGGQYRLSPTQIVYRLEDLGSLKDAAVFYSVGLDKELSGDGYARPLLEVLDSIKDSREGSPIFRAWLFLNLTDLMKLQPDAWGLSFCPTALADQAQIIKIVGGQLYSGDWLVGLEAKRFDEKLEQFFASKKSVSYPKQAAGLYALARFAAQSGIRYVGFIGLDGRPNFVGSSAPRAGEIWGWNFNHRPVLLTMKTGANNSFSEPVLPLSPLFVLDGRRNEFLARAGVNPGDPAFRDALPPLFGASSRKQP